MSLASSSPLGNTVVQLVTPTNSTAETTTVAGVDLKDFVGDLLVVLSYKRPNASAGAACLVQFLDSADNSTFAAVSAAPSISLAAADTQGTATVAITKRSIQRYLQAKYTTTGTTGTYNISLTAIGVKQVV